MTEMILSWLFGSVCGFVCYCFVGGAKRLNDEKDNVGGAEKTAHK